MNTSSFLVAVAGAGAIYLAICLGLLLVQNRLIFLPSSVLKNTPDNLGLTYEEVWLSVNNGNKIDRIHGWWLPGSSLTAGVLLYLHGIGFNIGANLGQASRYQALGFSVLLIDYRGYGQSKGTFPTETQVYQDAQVAWDYLVRERGIDPKNIFVYGHSLGGAVAIDLAVCYPEMAGLIVEGTFTSMREMVDYKRIYRWLPIELLLRHRFNTLDKITSIQTPILFIHGAEDRIVPPSMSQILFEAALVPKRLLIVPFARHNDVASIGGEEYLQAVRDFYQLVQESRSQLAER